jgi:hypothetical protein
MSLPLNKKLPDWRKSNGKKDSDGNDTKGKEAETSEPERQS